jgi:hypothetical protein
MTPPLTVVCWRWRPAPGYRSTFAPETVNVLRRMVARHYPDPHEFVCVTDDPAGIDPAIRIVPAWNDFAAVPSPHAGNKPSCYRRLRAFAPDIAAVLGPRFVSLDLDCVVVGDLRPVWNRPEPFVIWGDTHKRTRFNGSMFLLTAGARPQVWDRFDPACSPALAQAAGNFGSDQAWISYCLDGPEPMWSKDDGVFSYRLDIARAGGRLPKTARIVFWHGLIDPWSAEGQRLGWVREHYR